MLTLLKKTQSRSTSELFDKCTTEEWKRICYITNYHEIIRCAIELYTKELLDLQRVDMYKYVLNLYSTTPVDRKQQLEIKTIFYNNNIDTKKFCTDLITVLRKSDYKINGLKLYGNPDTCKSLIGNCIVAPFVCCYMNNHGSENEFFISNMLNKSIVLCEELFVTPATAEDFKSILGGQNIDISKKYNEKQLMCRTPIIITSNYKQFGRGHLPSLDESALDNRCFTYYFHTAYKPNVKITCDQFYLFVLHNMY